MIKAVILIGGRSTRMGIDKYKLKVDKTSNLDRLIELTLAKGLQTFVSCNQGQFEHLDVTVPKIMDHFPGVGPIGGIASCMRTDLESSWLVLACDLLRFDATCLNQLVGSWEGTYDAIIFKKKHSAYFESTAGVYNPGAYGVIQKQLEEGNYGLQNVLRQCSVKTLIPDDERVLKNVNTPEDMPK